MIVWITAMKNRTAQNRRVAPMNFNVNLVVVFPPPSDVIRKTIAEIIRMSLNAAM